MRIVNTSVGWLTNAEVCMALRVDAAREAARPAYRCSESAKEARDKVLAHFNRQSRVTHLAPTAISRCAALLAQAGLTEAEVIETLNWRPRTDVEFFLIIEQLAERHVSTTDLTSALSELAAAEALESERAPAVLDSITSAEQVRFAKGYRQRPLKRAREDDVPAGGPTADEVKPRPQKRAKGNM